MSQLSVDAIHTYPLNVLLGDPLPLGYRIKTFTRTRMVVAYETEQPVEKRKDILFAVFNFVSPISAVKVQNLLRIN